jgi:hypothetical protein
MHRSYPIYLPLPDESAALERTSRFGRADEDTAGRASRSEGSPMLTEVDTRIITGNGGTVTLYLAAASGPAPCYLVDVSSAEGERLASIAAETAAEALEAYRHPFARPDVPDIFGRAAA